MEFKGGRSNLLSGCVLILRKLSEQNKRILVSFRFADSRKRYGEARRETVIEQENEAWIEMAIKRKRSLAHKRETKGVKYET